MSADICSDAGRLGDEQASALQSRIRAMSKPSVGRWLRRRGLLLQGGGETWELGFLVLDAKRAPVEEEERQSSRD